MRFSIGSCMLSIIVLCFFCGWGAAQENKSLDVSGEIRLRSELDNRDFDSESEAYNYNLLRTRLQIQKHINNNIFAVVELQDSRVYGSEGSASESATRTNLANVDLHLGYVRMEKIFAPWLALQFGRMELAYGNQRLMAKNNWSNTGRTFDAALANISGQFGDVDIFAAQVYESQSQAYSQSPEEDGDLTIYGIWFKRPTKNQLTSNFYLLHDCNLMKNADDDIAISRTTIGTLLEGKLDNFNWSVEANYQTGTTSFTKDVSAYYLIGSAGYTLAQTQWKPTVTFTFNQLSGDDPKTSTNESFTTLYASRHRFFGYMDYFRSFPSDVKQCGLQDLTFGLAASPSTKISLNADLHLFQLAQEYETNGMHADALGKEIDLTLKYKLEKTVNLQFGYSIFQPDDLMEIWRGNDVSTWLYAQLVAGF